MFLWQPDSPSDFEQKAATLSRRMDSGDFFTRSVAHTFERYNSLGLLEEDLRIAKAEKEAGTRDYTWNMAQLAGLRQPHSHAMSEEEFKTRGYDRGGRIDYSPNMTPQRAAILAETFDRREREARLLDANSDTFGRKALGFGAGFLASLPDPINLIPVGGAMARGASLGTRMLRAGAEGVAGTALADAILLPEAKRRGEDVGFADFALDLVFGGLIGAGIGGAGGLLHNRRVKGLSAEQRMLTKVLTENGYDAGEAGRWAAESVNLLADMQRRQELALAVRKSLAGMDREGAGKLLDLTMLAMRNGETPDVGRWATQLGLQGHFTPGKIVDLEPAILAGAPVWPEDMDLNRLISTAKEWYRTNLDGKKHTIPGLGIVIFRSTAQGLGKIMSNIHPDKLRIIPFILYLIKKGELTGPHTPKRSEHQAQGMLIHKVRAFTRLGTKLLGVEMTLRQAKDGTYYYEHFVFDYPRIPGKKKTNPPT